MTDPTVDADSSVVAPDDRTTASFTRWSSTISWAFLAAGVASIAAFGAASFDAKTSLYAGIGIVSSLAIAAGVVLQRISSALPWTLLAVFVFCSTIAGIAPDHRDPLGAGSSDWQPEIWYWLGYACLAGGLWLLLPDRGRRMPGTWLDACLVGAAVGGVVFVLVIDRYEHEILHSAGAALLVARPVVDVGIVVVLARFLFAPGRRTSAYWLVTASVGALLVADLVPALIRANSEIDPWTSQAVWSLVAYVLLATAAIHPSRAAETAASSDDMLTGGRVVVLGGATLAMFATIGGAELLHVPVDATEASVASALIFLLLLFRVRGLVGRLESQAQELHTRQLERGRLLERTARAAEDERRRIAGELHDGPIQRLASVKIQLEQGLMRLRADNGAGAVEMLRRSEERLRAEIEGLRRIMVGLRPPILSERGLVTALRDHIESVAAQNGFWVRFEANDIPRIDHELETILFRAAQECIVNVVKHAQASRVWMTIRSVDGTISLHVRDDGVGFDARALADTGAPDHFGLVAIRERVGSVGGSVTVTSWPGAGTTIRITAPLGGGQDDAD
jgi:signal transduction histidine kinase